MNAAPLFRRPIPGSFVSTVIIGAGQAGLSMSRCLSRAGIDHVILERGEVGNSWRRERWDSLRLLSPNWQSRLIDYSYQGDDVDGFMSVNEFITYLDGYCETVSAPVHTGVTVNQVTRTQNGYRVLTDTGEWQCRALVIATGASNVPRVPGFARAVPASIDCLDTAQYKNPGQLRDGGVLVVGASASGLQLAEEIQHSGRQVTVAAGEQVRMPRHYRGRDIMWWLDRCGVLDQRYTEVEELTRARRVASLQLVGSNPARNLDINSLSREGVRFVGRLSSIQGHRALFSGSLANLCKMADLKMNRMLRVIDRWIDEKGLGDGLPPVPEMEPARVDSNPRLEVDLGSGEIRTILWATGYRPDYSWLKVPVLDSKGCLLHDGGVVDLPGLYVIGLPFLRRRKSVFIDGVADDARELSAHLSEYLQQACRRPLLQVAG